MASTIEDQLLFVLRNQGNVFRVFLEELKSNGQKEFLEEYISLSPLPIEEQMQIQNPKQVFQNDRLLIHSPFALDVANAHEFFGYASLRDYYESLRHLHPQRIKLAEMAHRLLNTHPVQTIPKKMNKFVEVNNTALFQYQNKNIRLHEESVSD